jgi:hypothetical protein
LYRAKDDLITYFAAFPSVFRRLPYGKDRQTLLNTTLHGGTRDVGALAPRQLTIGHAFAPALIGFRIMTDRNARACLRGIAARISIVAQDNPIAK